MYVCGNSTGTDNDDDGRRWRHTLHSLRVGWRNMYQLPWFFRESSVFIYCVTLTYVLFFEEFLIHDSRGFMSLKNNWPNLLDLCHFPLIRHVQTDGRTDRWTDWQTDELIRVGLGNLFSSSRNFYFKINPNGAQGTFVTHLLPKRPH